MTRRLSFLLLTGFVGLLGCEQSPAPAPSPTPVLGEPSSLLPPEPASNNEEPADAASSKVTLDIKNWDETLELVAQHTGKIVVLDLWSTACDPCLAEFPNLVALHKKHSRDKLVCMSASCDYAGIKNKPPESYRDTVLEFLTRQQATFQNVLLNVDTDTLFEKIDLGSIPAVYVFGADGQVAKRFDNDNAKAGEEFTYAKDVIPFVEKLLAE
jgi:thiol-disulfide isomerase/thioredoxin